METTPKVEPPTWRKITASSAFEQISKMCELSVGAAAWNSRRGEGRGSCEAIKDEVSRHCYISLDTEPMGS